MDNILNSLKEVEQDQKNLEVEQDQKNLEIEQDQKNLEIEPSSIYQRHIINYLTLINEINRDTFHIGC